jgi:hypothetical protein
VEKDKLERIEQYILNYFKGQMVGKVLTRKIFDSTVEYANADLVRALEDLEKWRLLVRYTEEGNDWTQLTLQGARLAGFTETEAEIIEQPQIQPHPPKSST